MHKLSLLLIFLFSLLLIQCKGKEGVASSEKAEAVLIFSQDDEKTTSQYIWLVASKKSPTNNFLVKHPGATQWKELNNDILKLDYKAGFEYTIKLQEEVYFATPDISKYTLLEVLDKKKKKSDFKKPSEQPFFENTTWNTKEYDEEKVKEGYIKFHETGASASVGCNSVGGLQFKLNKSKNTIKFNVKNSMMTSMACSNQGVMQRESKFWDLISSVDNYEATASELKLKNGDKVVMILER